MKKVFKDLEKLFQSEGSILTKANQIEELRLTIENPVELTDFVNKVRTIVQLEAKQAVIENGGRGILAMATGSGKSKVAIDLATYLAPSEFVFTKIALLVPTEKLRDENWKEEFIKWKAPLEWRATTSLCYASASKVSNNKFELVILDEGHNITQLNSSFFANNQVENIVMLTATVPTDPIKLAILKSLGLEVVYNLTLDVAVQLGFVSPYKVVVITVPLNSVDKNVVGGNKANSFMTTEQNQYNYLSETVEKTRFLGGKIAQFAIMRRMHAIYKLKSKEDVVKFLLNSVIPKKDRVLVFSANIEKASRACEYTYHSKSGNRGYDLFKSEQINQLSCVKAINEGHNLPNIDKAIAEQLTSKDKDIVQRIGRIIRFRPGHEAVLYIIQAEKTQDDVWVKTALLGLDQSKIEYITFNNLKIQYNANA
jgi:superfamily II DNA or RNA helicase